MHIRVINPVITRVWEQDTLRTYSSVTGPGVNVSVVSLDWGTASIESYRDDALATPDILNKVLQAEKEGVDAVIIDCMADPGLHAAREIVSIPVIGPAQASMHLAAILGFKFSVLSTSKRDIPWVEDQVTRYGLSKHLASVRPIDIPVLSLAENPEATFQALMQAAELAVTVDDAHVLVPGCTGLAGLASHLREGLLKRDLDVQVLDPPSVAMKLAESLVSLGYAHSKMTFPFPPTKEIRWPF
jgi:allantoin racemase